MKFIHICEDYKYSLYGNFKRKMLGFGASHERFHWPIGRWIRLK